MGLFYCRVIDKSTMLKFNLQNYNVEFCSSILTGILPLVSSLFLFIKSNIVTNVFMELQ